MLGGVCYVDLFAGDLEGMKSKIPYFKELGLTYLHLMPLFKAPEGENDGGYAVSSYREVHPPLGTMEQLASLAREFRSAGISLVVDLVFNHTSDEHIWAERAKARAMKNIWTSTVSFRTGRCPMPMSAICGRSFPMNIPGAFTFFPDLFKEGGWVWTTFHSYQWDLNYANPAVFNRMAEEMLFLANQGVEVIRLDAVAFIWKELGTSCENLPEAHPDPGLQRRGPHRLAGHAFQIGSDRPSGRCGEIYRTGGMPAFLQSTLMALLWNSLPHARYACCRQLWRTVSAIRPGTAWVNYVQVHDDIGWTFSDEDAAILGVNGYDHRRF